MMMMMGETWTQIGSAIASIMFLWAMLHQYFPQTLHDSILAYIHRLVNFLSPNIQIRFHEFSGEYFERSEAYAAIKRYLSDKSSWKAKNFRAEVVEYSTQSVVLSMDENEEVTDEYKGVKLRWVSKKNVAAKQSISWYPNTEGNRYYKLNFHKSHREFVTGTYLPHVLQDGKAIRSSMIAAMANHLEYDIYDLELTTLIIVIEDIKCSLDLTGQRKKETKKAKAEEANDPISKMTKEEEEEERNGLWSACAGERIVVFTTSFVERLDPALIWRGRMDKHIELSYCCFEAFKVLAKNYLDVDSHQLFATIGHLFEETNMTPADVAENLMPKSLNEDVETVTCQSLRPCSGFVNG
ncbi:aaa-atpase [Quercus suber]|uniref:Aaa-atpase n=1 Tax=Quercus suber TaxID=58331 RepID=A0AAW0KXV0_QUESU